jgi:hypothetical protein
VSINELTENVFDTVFAECGYINLQESSGNFRVFYQVHIDDLETVLGKGFTYIVDTFVIEKSNILQYDSLFDSLCNLPYETEVLENEIRKYNYRISEQNGPIITLLNEEVSDTIFMGLEVEQSFTENEMIVVRRFNYFKLK